MDVSRSQNGVQTPLYHPSSPPHTPATPATPNSVSSSVILPVLRSRSEPTPGTLEEAANTTPAVSRPSSASSLKRFPSVESISLEAYNDSASQPDQQPAEAEPVNPVDKVVQAVQAIEKSNSEKSSPLSSVDHTPSSSPTLRLSTVLSLARRTPVSSPAHSRGPSPVASPGSSPPSSGLHQSLSNVSVTVNNISAVPSATNSGVNSNSSSVAPSPFTSPRLRSRGSKPVSIDVSAEEMPKMRATQDIKMETSELVPSYTQKIPSNISAILIVDADGDGKNELLVGTYDQSLFMFAFASGEDPAGYYDSETSASRPASPTEFAPKPLPAPTSTGERKCLKLKHKWKLPGQVGSIHMCESLVVIGLCEGTYITLDVKTGDIEYNYNGNQPSIYSSVRGFKPIITNVSDCFNITVTMLTCKTIAGPLLVNKQDEEAEKTQSLFAAATLDGILQLADMKQQPHWELKVGDGQMCMLSTMDMIGDKVEEAIVGCWWDGTTLIVDRQRNIAAFRFDGRVSAFQCGDYAVHPGNPVPCFVYVTLFGEVTLFYDIRIPSIQAKTLASPPNGKLVESIDASLNAGILYEMDRKKGAEHIQSLRAKLQQLQDENRELAQRLQNK